jgi:hypothetical protein
MWGVPSSAGWRHSATTWSQWSGMSKPQALGFGEIAASSRETIVRRVRYRPCSMEQYVT